MTILSVCIKSTNAISCFISDHVLTGKLTANCSFQNYGIDSKIVKIPGYDLPNTIQYLFFKGNSIQHLSRDSFRNLQKLEKIDVSLNNITKIEPETFAGLPNLRYIDLNSNNIGHIDARIFDRLLSPIVDVNINHNSLACDQLNFYNVQKLREIQVFVRNDYCHQIWEMLDFNSMENFESGTLIEQKLKETFIVKTSHVKIRFWELVIFALSFLTFCALLSLFVYISIKIIRLIWRLKVASSGKKAANRDALNIDESESFVVRVSVSESEGSTASSQLTTSVNYDHDAEMAEENEQILHGQYYNLFSYSERDFTILDNITSDETLCVLWKCQQKNAN